MIEILAGEVEPRVIDCFCVFVTVENSLYSISESIVQMAALDKRSQEVNCCEVTRSFAYHSMIISYYRLRMSLNIVINRV